jgi:cytochrome c peroxidase
MGGLLFASLSFFYKFKNLRMLKARLSFLLIITLYAFGNIYEPEHTSTVKDVIYSKFISDFNQIEKTLEIFSEVKEGTSDLELNYIKLRRQFKASEPLLYYLFKDEYNRYLNGAPLPKLEPSVPEISIIQPKGLQRLDELMNEEQIDIKSVKKIAKDMLTSIRYIKKIIGGIKIQDRYILEASRIQLVRIASLSLSGFDTPGGSNYLDDIKSNIHTLSFIFDKYDQDVIVDMLDNLLEDVNLKQNVEVVDVASLIKDYINPIYKEILDYHLDSGIEHVSEASDQLLQVNYYTENIFDEDFLNPSTYSRIVPTPYFPQQSNLGKLLFHDPIMSKDKTKTCGSCHNPALAFTDGLKVMLNDQPSSQKNRNTPTLINSIFSKKYFHDMRASKPDLQVDHVVYNDEEFNIDYVELIKRLKSNETYTELFSEAFPDNTQAITRYTITTSFTQYVTSLSGFDSQFDRYMRGEIDDIDSEVLKGFNLFMGKGACGSCHFLPTFNGLVPPGFDESESEILGVLATNDFNNPLLDQDPGRMQNGNLKEASEIYNRSFKTPTVRNVSLTAPYMHNGVHTTLEEVMTFYNNGGGQGMGLKVPYQTLPPDSLGLTTAEQDQIIRFMESLVDTLGMTNMPNLPLSSKQ